MICMAVLQCYINPRDFPCNLIHSFCFLNVVSWPYIPILKWTVVAHVVSSTYPTLKRLYVLLWISWLFSHHPSWLTHGLRWLLLLIPEIRRFEIFLPLIKLFIILILTCLMVIGFSFDFLIKILSLSYRSF